MLLTPTRALPKISHIESGKIGGGWSWVLPYSPPSRVCDKFLKSMKLEAETTRSSNTIGFGSVVMVLLDLSIILVLTLSLSFTSISSRLLSRRSSSNCSFSATFCICSQQQWSLNLSWRSWLTCCKYLALSSCTCSSLSFLSDNCLSNLAIFEIKIPTYFSNSKGLGDIGEPGEVKLIIYPHLSFLLNLPPHISNKWKKNWIKVNRHRMVHFLSLYLFLNLLLNNQGPINCYSLPNADGRYNVLVIHLILLMTKR